MYLINDISRMIISLIRAVAVFRVSFCFFKMIMVDEERSMYKKRLKNTLTFYVIAESAFVIKSIIMTYYS